MTIRFVNILKKRANSFLFAFSGIIQVVKSQPNARIHLVATFIVIITGLLVSVSITEWGLLSFAITGVWVAECFNTALEFLADKVCQDYDILIRKAKDIAAGAVLLAAVNAVIIGALVFVPKLIEVLVE